jgi:Homeodomain-like domain
MLCGMATPDELERQVTLRTAVARYEQLWTRNAVADGVGDDEAADTRPLTRAEALELLALAEVIARKARYGRQLAVRTARTAGASWSQIGQALGISKQTAWEAHTRWIDQQVQLHHRSGHAGLDDDAADEARALAGAADEEASHDAAPEQAS